MLYAALCFLILSGDVFLCRVYEWGDSLEKHEFLFSAGTGINFQKVKIFLNKNFLPFRSLCCIVSCSVSKDFSFVAGLGEQRHSTKVVYW